MASNGMPPKGWQCKRLDEVADIRFSSVDKHIHATETPVRLCNYMEVWKNPYIHEDLDFMEGSATQQEIERFALQPGDVLLTKDSETKDEIAEPSLVREQIDGLVLGYHLALLRPDESQVLGAFLAAQLRIPEFRAHFIRTASGVTRYGLSMETVASAEVWLPTPDVQRRIAAILRATDDAIERTRAVIDQTSKLKTALLQDLLTNGLLGRHKKFQQTHRFRQVPADWQVSQIQDNAEVTQGIALGPHRKPRKNATPYLRVANVQNGFIDYSEIKQIEATEEERTKYALRTGDVLIVEGHANIEDLGRAALVPSAVESMVFQNHLFRIRTNPDQLDARYLAYWINSPPGRTYFRIFGGTTSGLNTVGSSQIRTLRLPLPSVKEQHCICDVVESTDHRIRVLVDDLTQLHEMKSALSQALLTGRVRVPTKGGK